MKSARLATDQLRPDLVAGQIGGQHLGAARSAVPGPAARMAGTSTALVVTVKGDVVVIEYMRRDAVDERRVGDAAAFAARNERCAVFYRGAGERPIHQSDNRFACAGHHHGVAIGKAGPGDGPSPLGN